jgi:tyrosyl-tRNA synthetase
MFATHTRLGASHAALMSILRSAPPRATEATADMAAVLELLAERRTLDLTDLPPAEQADLIAARSAQVLPSREELASRLSAGRPLVVKFGIDPTAADVHLGHAVPIILASRFQRMGHRVVLIVGDVTAKIGDPSGRTADRPALTDADIARNLATYRAQMAPFVDVDRAGYRFNGEWLGRVGLPEFLGVLQRVPVSAALQREDFRDRLGAGNGLSLAELVYSVVMALDSAEVVADVEIGGLDQLLNLQMCRRIMADAGQVPEVVVATGLIEGTDGSGAKMSKSRGNYIGLAFAARDVFGRLMAAPDRLLPTYLAALTELLDPEIELLLATAHPLAVKTMLAADVTAAVHGPAAATECRTAFAAQFSRRRYSAVPGLPVVAAVDLGQSTVAEVLVRLVSVVPSLNQVRRVAAGGGLRLVVESADDPSIGSKANGSRTFPLSIVDANTSLAELLDRHSQSGSRTFIACGRSVVEVSGTPGKIGPDPRETGGTRQPGPGQRPVADSSTDKKR